MMKRIAAVGDVWSHMPGVSLRPAIDKLRQMSA
jgi:hypothetical protein